MKTLLNDEKYGEAEEKIVALMPRALKYYDNNELALGMAEVIE